MSDLAIAQVPHAITILRAAVADAANNCLACRGDATVVTHWENGCSVVAACVICKGLRAALDGTTDVERCMPVFMAAIQWAEAQRRRETLRKAYYDTSTFLQIATPGEIEARERYWAARQDVEDAKLAYMLACRDLAAHEQQESVS